MVKAEMLTWIRTEFKPLCITTPDETIEQAIDSAFRYWNNHSGFKTIEMVNTQEPRVQLSNRIKFVAKVYPASMNAFDPFQGHPLWSLLGITILDNVTSDIITLTESFKNYQAYIGEDFQWDYVKSDDPSEGGYLYVANLPYGADRLAVVGTLRIFNDDDIKNEYILDWLLRYSKSLVKQVEGNTLRKSAVVGINNDGQQYYDEGRQEMLDLQEQLARDGRWVALARRF